MKNRPLCCVCLVVIIIQSIVLIYTGGWSVKDAPAFSVQQRQEDGQVSVSGTIYKKSVSSNVQSLYLKSNSNPKSNILVYDSNFNEISYGDVVAVTGAIQRFDCARNPGNFDSAFYYACQDIYSSVFAEQIVILSKKQYYCKRY